MTRPLGGFLRRAFRASLRREAGKREIPRVRGTARLWGYGFGMEYPDRRVWIHQVLEIFGEDCYGVGTLPPDARIVDGGANIGTFALYTLWRRPGAHVVAVEPGPDNLAALHRNVARAGKEAACRVVPVALGAGKGHGTVNTESTDGTRLDAGGTESVDIVPLADVLDGPADLVKLDVEGAEFDVLEGAGDALQSVKRLVVEYHRYRDGARPLSELLSLMERHGFERFRVSGHREFNEPDPMFPTHCCLVDAWRTGGSGEQRTTNQERFRTHETQTG